MIGLKFLMTFVTAAIYFAVAMALVLFFFFVVTWALRLLANGFRVGLFDHWSWFRGFVSIRKKKVFTGQYEVLSPDDNVTVVCTTENPEYWVNRGYIVKEVYHES